MLPYDNVKIKIAQRTHNDLNTSQYGDTMDDIVNRAHSIA